MAQKAPSLWGLRMAHSALAVAGVDGLASSGWCHESLLDRRADAVCFD